MHNILVDHELLTHYIQVVRQSRWRMRISTAAKFKILAMATVRLYVMIAVLMLGRGRETEAFWWPFSSSEERKEASDASSVASREPVAFEMASAEQKFLAEAQQFLNLPPLEACQHEVCVP